MDVFEAVSLNSFRVDGGSGVVYLLGIQSG